MQKLKKLEGNLINLKDACWLIDMSQPNFIKLVKEGVFSQAGPSSYCPRTLYKEHWQYKMQSEDSPRKTIEEQKAAKLTRENRVANRELIEMTTLREVVALMLVAFKSWIRSLPGRVASTGAMSEASVLREIIRVECARVIEELRDSAEKGLIPNESIPDEDETDTHSGRMGSTN